MTYILAIAKERNLTLSSVEDLKTSVVEVIDLILRDYDINPEAFSTDSTQLRKELTEIVGESEENEVDSLVELFSLRNNISEELDDLFAKGKREREVSVSFSVKTIGVAFTTSIALRFPTNSERIRLCRALTNIIANLTR